MADTVAARLLRSAAIDVAACKALAAAPGMADTVIGFHAQQACGALATIDELPAWARDQVDSAAPT